MAVSVLGPQSVSSAIVELFLPSHTLILLTVQNLQL